MSQLRSAIDIAPLDDLGDPDTFVRLAVAAEAAGWDGVSTWDIIGASRGTVVPDPLLLLAAAAAATTRIRLITNVMALPRQRPQLVARAAATLDRISHGRLVLGIGAGGNPGDFEAFGEAYDATRFERYDEAADVVDRLLRGERLSHAGAAYTVRDVSVGPRPAHQPRPPLWVGAGAAKPGGVRRIVRYDGWLAYGSDGASAMAIDAETFRAQVAAIAAARAASGRSADAFDMALVGVSEPGDGVPERYAAAGATWWIEGLSLARGPVAALLARIEAGPPVG